jgi:hypothetical protein
VGATGLAVCDYQQVLGYGSEALPCRKGLCLQAGPMSAFFINSFPLMKYALMDVKGYFYILLG